MLLLQLKHQRQQQQQQQQQQQHREWRVAEAAKTFFFEVDRKEPLAIINALPELLTALAVATAPPATTSSSTSSSSSSSSSSEPEGALATAGKGAPTVAALQQDRERLLA